MHIECICSPESEFECKKNRRLLASIHQKNQIFPSFDAALGENHWQLCIKISVFIGSLVCFCFAFISMFLGLCVCRNMLLCVYNRRMRVHYSRITKSVNRFLIYPYLFAIVCSEEEKEEKKNWAYCHVFSSPFSNNWSLVP